MSKEKEVYITEVGLEDMKKELEYLKMEKRPEVRQVVYVSAQEAWEGFKEDYLGEYADGFTENPLEDSQTFRFTLMMCQCSRPL